MSTIDSRSPGSTHSSPRNPAAMLLLGFVVLVLAGVVFLSVGKQGKMTRALLVGDAMMHAQRIAKAAPHMLAGEVEGFSMLRESSKALEADLKILGSGGDFHGMNITAPDGEALALVNEARKAAGSSQTSAKTIMSLKTDLSELSLTHRKMKVMTPLLEDLSTKISTLKIQGGATPREISSASQLSMLTQRLARSANEISTVGGVSPETAFLLGKDANTFGNIIDGFLNGSEVLRLPATRDQETRDRLTELQSVFGEYQKLTGQILMSLQKLIAANQAAQQIWQDDEPLAAALSKLQKYYLSH
jgi:twitching motility protein PilJ